MFADVFGFAFEEVEAAVLEVRGEPCTDPTPDPGPLRPGVPEGVPGVVRGLGSSLVGMGVIARPPIVDVDAAAGSFVLDPDPDPDAAPELELAP